MQVQIQAFTDKLADMLDSWSTRKTRGLWARPVVLTPVPVPVQAIHSGACLNSHHSDIQSTAQKSPLSALFDAIKKQGVTVWVPGSSGQDMETQDNGHVREHSDTIHTGQRTRERTE